MKDWSDKTILIAEDDTINFNLLSIMLRSTKIKVLWAKNGLEAVNLFSGNNTINAILMDIQMPVMDGNEASLRIRQINKQVPIIVISAYTSMDVKLRAKEVGTNEYINKPVQSTRLVEIIEKYLFLEE
jgi:two-component system, cell cycle response regulator DivK